MRVISITVNFLIFALVVLAQESRGAPGVDYPNHVSIPKTSFSCAEQKYIPGFYADVESQCQVFHYCMKNRKETFLCPPKFIFNQAILGCDFWYNSNCSLAPLLYSKNSGILLETARRKLPLLIKLRNRSLSKSLAQPAADVYEKITSLYESSTDVTQSVTEPLNSNDNVEMGSEPEAEFKAEAKPLDIKDSEIDSQELSNLNVDEPNEEPEEEAYLENLGETGENLEGGIFYDPVTEQYYVNYDSSQDEWQQDSGDSVEELYDYGSLPDNDNLGLPDYDERSNTENDFSTEQILSLDWDESQETEREQFLRRALNTKQFPKRLRRKPMFTVIPDEEYHADGKEYTNLGSDIGSLSDDDTLKVSPESEVSVSSSQDDSDTAPDESELDVLASSESQNDEGELQNIDISTTSEEEQESLDDIVIYNDKDAEDLSQGDLESNPEESDDDDIIIVEEPDSGVEIEEREEDVNWSADEPTVEGHSGVDDALIVIPDESDVAGSGRMLQTDENIISEDETTEDREEQDESQSDAAYNYEALREYCILNCGCYNVYPSMDSPFQDYRMYYPDEIQGQKQLPHEGYFNPGEGSQFTYSDAVYTDANFASSNPESPDYGVAQDSSMDSSLVESESREYERPMSSAGYMYGSSDGYYDQFYNNVYMNQYAQNMAYAGPGSEVSGYPQTLSETPDEAVTYDYSDSAVLPIQEGLNGKLEVEHAPLSSHSPLQSDVLTSKGKLEDGSLGDQRGTKNDETFYVFDFDEDSVKPAVELAGPTSDANVGQAALEESSHPWQTNESSEGEVKSNLSSDKASNSEAGESSFPISEDSVKGNDDTKSGSSYVTDAKTEFTGTLSAAGKRDPQKPGTLTPSSEQFGDLSSQNLPWASDVNEYLSQDKYLQSMGFPEPMDFGPYGIAATAGQQQSSANSFSTKDFNSFSHRTGNAGIPKLSVIQDRIRSLKQGKFGAFKKYMNAAGSKN